MTFPWLSVSRAIIRCMWMLHENCVVSMFFIPIPISITMRRFTLPIELNLNIVHIPLNQNYTVLRHPSSSENPITLRITLFKSSDELRRLTIESITRNVQPHYFPTPFSTKIARFTSSIELRHMTLFVPLSTIISMLESFTGLRNITF